MQNLVLIVNEQLDLVDLRAPLHIEQVYVVIDVGQLFETHCHSTFVMLIDHWTKVTRRQEIMRQNFEKIKQGWEEDFKVQHRRPSKSWGEGESEHNALL